MNPNHPLTKLRIGRILALLAHADLNQNELMEQAFMCQVTAYKYIKLMVAENLAHIPCWAQPNGLFRHIPVLRAGPGISVPRPPRMSDKERNDRWKARIKKDPERLQRLRAGKNARRLKITPDPLQAWIPVRAVPRGEA